MRSVLIAVLNTRSRRAELRPARGGFERGR